MSQMGRNPIPFGNSASRTLMENWVEERGVKDMLGDDRRPLPQRFRDGHHGLLTTAVAPAVQDQEALERPEVGQFGTTTASTHRPCAQQAHQAVGSRRQLLQQQVREFVTAELESEVAEPPPEVEKLSTMKADYTSDYQPLEDVTVGHHDVYREPVASFWQAEVQSGKGLAGVSALPSQSAPFRKNATFSTPADIAIDGQDR